MSWQAKASVSTFNYRQGWVLEKQNGERDQINVSHDQLPLSMRRSGSDSGASPTLCPLSSTDVYIKLPCTRVCRRASQPRYGTTLRVEMQYDKTNLQKLFQDADELHRFRLKDFRSDEELGRLKEDHKLEIRQIHALGAEEYRVQLELECQRRKWVFKGQPIDAKRWDVLDARISQYFQRSQVRRSDQHPRFRTSYLERTICPIITCEV